LHRSFTKNLVYLACRHGNYENQLLARRYETVKPTFSTSLWNCETNF